MTTPAHIPAPCGCCTYVVSGELARLLPADCLRPCPTGADPGVQYAPLSLVLAALALASVCDDCTRDVSGGPL